jgi:hypothetical protein
MGNSMSPKASAKWAAILAAAVAVSTGCSGGNGSPNTDSTGTVGTSRSATVNLYVTDKFRDDWSQVLVTLYSIEGSTDNGATYTTLYSSDAGQSIDLASLGQAAQLLSSANVPVGTITSVRVTLGDSVSLTAKADGSVKTVTVDPTLPNVTVADGKAAFTFQASTPLAAGKLSNLVVDFNLAAFELISGKIRPSLVPGGASAFDGKQKVAHLSGTVSNYVEGSGFDLTPDCGQHGPRRATAGVPSTLHVTLTAATLITSGSGATAAVANGATVSVKGDTDAANGGVTATVVHVRDAANETGGGGNSAAPRSVRVMGRVASLGSDGASSFTLTVRDGEHLPAAAAGTLTVQTTASTTFRQGKSDTATAATFSAVTANSYVFAVGTLDPSTGVLTATTVAILPDAPPGHAWPTARGRR